MKTNNTILCELVESMCTRCNAKKWQISVANHISGMPRQVSIYTDHINAVTDEKLCLCLYLTRTDREYSATASYNNTSKIQKQYKTFYEMYDDLTDSGFEMLKSTTVFSKIYDGLACNDDEVMV